MSGSTSFWVTKPWYKPTITCATDRGLRDAIDLAAVLCGLDQVEEEPVRGFETARQPLANVLVARCFCDELHVERAVGR